MSSLIKIFISSLFVSFLISKLIDMNNKLQKPSGNNEILNLIFDNIKIFFDYININQFKAPTLINLGNGYEGTSLLLNNLIMFTPIFFILFLIIFIITKPLFKEK